MVSQKTFDPDHDVEIRILSNICTQMLSELRVDMILLMMSVLA